MGPLVSPEVSRWPYAGSHFGRGTVVGWVGYVIQDMRHHDSWRPRWTVDRKVQLDVTLKVLSSQKRMTLVDCDKFFTLMSISHSMKSVCFVLLGFMLVRDTAFCQLLLCSGGVWEVRRHFWEISPVPRIRYIITAALASSGVLPQIGARNWSKDVFRALLSLHLSINTYRNEGHVKRRKEILST